jgi:uncharacterized oligopeptide transporter (OPT) family protein
MITFVVCLLGGYLVLTLCSVITPLIAAMSGNVSGLMVSLMTALQDICHELPSFVEAFSASIEACPA